MFSKLLLVFSQYKHHSELFSNYHAHQLLSIPQYNGLQLSVVKRDHCLQYGSVYTIYPVWRHWFPPALNLVWPYTSFVYIFIKFRINGRESIWWTLSRSRKFLLRSVIFYIGWESFLVISYIIHIYISFTLSRYIICISVLFSFD